MVTPFGVLAVIVTVAGVPWLPFGATVLRWDAMAVGSLLLLRSGTIESGPGHKLGLALCAWMACGLLWTVSAWDTLGGMLRFIEIALVFCLAAQYDDFRPVWFGLLVGSIVNAAVAAFQMAGMVPAPGWIASGLFAGKSPAAEIAVLSIVGAFALPWRFWPLIVAPLFSIFAVGSREALLSLGAAGAAFAVNRYGRTAFAVITIIAVMLLPIGIVMAADGKLGSFEDRMVVWALVSRGTWLVGDGLGAMAMALPWLDGAYNEYLHFAFELGFGSVLLWGIVAYAFGVSRPIEVAALAAVLAQCCVSNPLHTPATAFVAAALAGHLCGVHDRDGRRRAGGGVPGLARAEDPWTIGIGALHEADLARLDVPARSRDAVAA